MTERVIRILYAAYHALGFRYLSERDVVLAIFTDPQRMGLRNALCADPFTKEGMTKLRNRYLLDLDMADQCMKSFGVLIKLGQFGRESITDTEIDMIKSMKNASHQVGRHWWWRMANSMKVEDAVVLFRGMVLAECIGNWGGGSVTPTQPVYNRIARSLSSRETQNILDWCRDNRCNDFTPLGAMDR